MLPGRPTREDQPVPGPLPAPPGRQLEDPPGEHVGSPGPGCRRIQGGRGCNALPSARRAPGRSVLPVRPPRVLVASQPHRAFSTLLSGAARTGRRCRGHGATSRPRGIVCGRAATSGAHLGWRLTDAEPGICRFPLPDVPTWGPSFRTWESHKPWGFELRAPEYIFLCNMGVKSEKVLSSERELGSRCDGSLL